ncbi:hypothetical protein [Streptomyces phaeochromogenes]|uniref:hypothetical protein n=1 Tax=Streptomyces phaeochromogenes TaxID=1923 RepID=UPI002DD8454F|nr:hypothetical protein [Streptomyces phaeochromogenes]WRZ29972.1 hypothetical protein OG931_20580 [Streptomyces phaeochromogenes]
MSPTPKQARQHRRKAAPTDRTKNVTSWRIEASWDHRPDDPVVIRTSDKKRARKAFRGLVAKGAYVIFQEHAGWDRWRTVDEQNGADLLAERAAEQQLATAGHPQTPVDYQPDAVDRRRSWLARMEVRAEQTACEQVEQGARRQRLAVEAHRDARALMSPPAIVRPENRQRARHITGAQR